MTSSIASIGRIHQEIAQEPREFISTSATDAMAVRYLNELFRNAARRGISDVHFEDREGACVIRFRHNGEMEETDRVSLNYSREFDGKIRMKCKLSLSERMSPLDGKFRFEVDGRDVDVRVSILPLAHGQSIVCRLLDQKANLINLDDIDMPGDIRAAIGHIIAQPQGLFLVTGPTGSGKTTTLYGILQQLNTPDVKILTVEDPVEYRLPGISQAQTNPKLTFASALKSMLRQDPDIILVGEIRDSETARIATQAALTGHIVLSTLHTNSALVTLNRLLDLEVDPHALGAAMGGFMAQRLARRLCPYCRCPRSLTEDARYQMRYAGVTEELMPPETVIYEPGGCPQCRDGWNGRIPVFELVTATPDVRLAIEEGNLKGLERAAHTQPQYRSLGRHAMQLVLEGRTSLLEAMAVTGSTQVQLDEAA
ncbi:type II/IV secretion system protein [Allochromatium humboldtianum]|uniref:Type II/IV secretion system protein n=1 Tax=Allochromatium humboldtianum TaxID=504901 RepID=A0A850RFF8_9GAMM|nr:GspE/PulE family protein [Allochromatium humboldtianum]NVZ11775.1 type II/IV secretion system protein [Allochromatium humboldtianum]